MSTTVRQWAFASDNHYLLRDVLSWPWFRVSLERLYCHGRATRAASRVIPNDIVIIGGERREKRTTDRRLSHRMDWPHL